MNITEKSNINRILEINRNNSKTAIIYKNYNFTFKELDQIANQVSEKIAKLGKNLRIGLLCHNDHQFIISFFAILKAKCSVVLLNPKLHPRELKKLCVEADIECLITYKKIYVFLRENNFLNDEFSKQLTYILFDSMETEPQVLGSEISKKNNIINSKKDEAVIVFTSGVTGSIKGVILTHQNFMSNMLITYPILKCNSNDVVLTVLPLYHVAALRFVLTHILVGATTHLFHVTTIADFINAYIDKNNITSLSANPFFLSIMLERQAGSSKYPMNCLKIITSGGSTMSEKLRNQLLDQFPHIDFYSLYGLSEATSIVSILNPQQAKIKVNSVGKIIPNTAYKIVKNDKRNKFGELWLKGPGVMKGYLDACVKDVLNKNGWLRTGDLVSIDKNKDLTIIGRKKELINIAGYKISPKEIESVIQKHQDVKEAVVIGKEMEPYGEVLVAIIEPMRKDLKEIDIIKFCKEHLATFKIPKEIIITNKLYITQSGKIDKKKIKNFIKRRSIKIS